MCCWNQLRQGCDLAGEELCALASPSVCVHACMHVCVCVHADACLRMCMHIHVLVYMYVCIFGHGCGCIHVYVCVCNIVVKEEGLNTHFSVLTYYMQRMAGYPAIVHTLIGGNLGVATSETAGVTAYSYIHVLVYIEHTLVQRHLILSSANTC